MSICRVGPLSTSCPLMQFKAYLTNTFLFFLEVFFLHNSPSQKGEEKRRMKCFNDVKTLLGLLANWEV